MGTASPAALPVFSGVSETAGACQLSYTSGTAIRHLRSKQQLVCYSEQRARIEMESQPTASQSLGPHPAPHNPGLRSCGSKGTKRTRHRVSLPLGIVPRVARPNIFRCLAV